MSWPTRVTTKRTYYQNRGKVHLKGQHGKTMCGNDLGDMNHTTTKIPEVTCQKCLMYKTRKK